VESFKGSATFAKNYQGLTDLSFGTRFGYQFHHIEIQAGAGAVRTWGRLKEAIGSCTSPTACHSSIFINSATLWGYEYLGRISIPICPTMGSSPLRMYAEWSRTDGLRAPKPGSTLVPDYSSNRLMFGVGYRF
jgi:hypothetical protein